MMRILGLSVLSGRAEPAHAFEQARDQFPFLGCHEVLLQTTSLLQSLSRRGSTAMISFCSSRAQSLAHDERSVLFKPSAAFRAGGQVTGSHLAFVCGKRS